MLSHSNAFKITFPEKFFNCPETTCSSVRLHSAIESIRMLPDNYTKADGVPKPSQNWTEEFDPGILWDTFRVKANTTLIEYAILNQAEEFSKCEIYGYPFNAFKVCLKHNSADNAIICENSF